MRDRQFEEQYEALENFLLENSDRAFEEQYKALEDFMLENESNQNQQQVSQEPLLPNDPNQQQTFQDSSADFGEMISLYASAMDLLRDPRHLSQAEISEWQSIVILIQIEIANRLNIRSERLARELYGEERARELYGEERARELYGEEVARELHGEEVARELSAQEIPPTNQESEGNNESRNESYIQVDPQLNQAEFEVNHVEPHEMEEINCCLTKLASHAADSYLADTQSFWSKENPLGNLLRSFLKGDSLRTNTRLITLSKSATLPIFDTFVKAQDSFAREMWAHNKDLQKYIQYITSKRGQRTVLKNTIINILKMSTDSDGVEFAKNFLSKINDRELLNKVIKKIDCTLILKNLLQEARKFVIERLEALNNNNNNDGYVYHNPYFFYSSGINNDNNNNNNNNAYTFVEHSSVTSGNSFTHTIKRKEIFGETETDNKKSKRATLPKFVDENTIQVPDRMKRRAKDGANLLESGKVNYSTILAEYPLLKEYLLGKQLKGTTSGGPPTMIPTQKSFDIFRKLVESKDPVAIKLAMAMWEFNKPLQAHIQEIQWHNFFILKDLTLSILKIMPILKMPTDNDGIGFEDGVNFVKNFLNKLDNPKLLDKVRQIIKKEFSAYKETVDRFMIQTRINQHLMDKNSVDVLFKDHQSNLSFMKLQIELINKRLDELLQKNPSSPDNNNNNNNNANPETRSSRRVP